MEVYQDGVRVNVLPDCAVFSRDFEPEIVLTDKEIEEELMKGWEK